MQLRQPRRIFRGSSPVRRAPPARALPGMLAVLAVAVCGAGGAVALRAGSVATRPAAGAAPAGVTLSGSGAAVVDGETLRLDDTVVRLAGVEAPARGRTCRHDDGAGYDCGAAATRALAGLVLDRPLSCRLQGRDGAGLALGACRVGATDVNTAIVAAGWARAASGAGTLAQAEAQARAARRGAWQGQGL